MSAVCVSLPLWAHVLVWILVFGFEAWLDYKKFFGRGSTLGILAVFVGIVFKTFFTRRL